MEFLNNKQKVIIFLLGIGMLIFIGYYFVKKTESSNYSQLSIIEDNNVIEEETINNKKENDEEQSMVIHITGEVNNEGIVKIEKRR